MSRHGRILKTKVKGLIFFMVLFVCYGLYDFNTPKKKTVFAIQDAKPRFMIFYSKSHKMPENSSQLPNLKHLSNENKDGWGVPLKFKEKIKNQQYCIFSYGADKQLGGKGENKDIEGCFLVVDENGEFADIYGPFIKKQN